MILWYYFICCFCIVRENPKKYSALVFSQDVALRWLSFAATQSWKRQRGAPGMGRMGEFVMTTPEETS